MKSSLDTQVFTTIKQYRQWRSALTDDGSGRPLLGLVPTMGALHRGHVKLIEQARSHCQRVVVSIFVNPLQFGPNEDFDRYPRTFSQDLQACSKAGVDAIFHPEVQEFYPLQTDQVTRVVPPGSLINKLEGTFRPGHFEGVATVVMKLFQVAQQNCAFFGEKDYQQLLVIRRMVADLNLPTEIIGVPTVREDDGLAMSSRNVNLTPEARALAPRLNRVLQNIINQSSVQPSALQDLLFSGRAELQAIAGVELQYLEACDAQTLEPLTVAHKPMVVLVAARLGAVRLIDNLIAR
jgi:pantoate--beta-alanine ligase